MIGRVEDSENCENDNKNSYDRQNRKCTCFISEKFKKSNPPLVLEHPSLQTQIVSISIRIIISLLPKSSLKASPSTFCSFTFTQGLQKIIDFDLPIQFENRCGTRWFNPHKKENYDLECYQDPRNNKGTFNQINKSFDWANKRNNNLFPQIMSNVTASWITKSREWKY